MRDAYKKLENGNFSDSLQYINEILILFSNFFKKRENFLIFVDSLPQPILKQKEIEICVLYIFALKLLMKQNEKEQSPGLNYFF